MHAKPSDVVDRDREWAVLSTLWERTSPELAFVVGRRRVGKSYLLARFARVVGGIYYQATRRTEAEQLAGLSRVIGQHFGELLLDIGQGFSSWETLFAFLTERAAGKPLLLVLDEFPYLADAAPALTSIIQKFWDHDWADSRVKLVLSGSYLTAMTQLEHADQPLYGRRTCRLTFSPFGVPEVTAFVPEWSVRDTMIAYGIFGHLPGHLALLDPARTLAENIAMHVFDSSGRLVDDASHVLDAFTKDAAVHYSILEAVANGSTTWSKITSRVGRAGGSLLRPLTWLEGMGLLRRDAPITEPRADRSKQAIYRVIDPYLAFWHRVVAPLIHNGSLGLVPATQLWEQVGQRRTDDHMGPVYEEICRDFIRREASTQSGRLPFAPQVVGSWWEPKTAEEVDLVAIGGEGQLLVGEAKWGPVSERHVATLKRRADLVAAALGGAQEVHLALFTGKEETPKDLRKLLDSNNILLFQAGELLKK